MIEYATNPFKIGIDSVVTALTLFDCDGNEIKVKETKRPEAHVTFKLPLISNLTQVGFMFLTTTVRWLRAHVCLFVVIIYLYLQ